MHLFPFCLLGIALGLAALGWIERVHDRAEMTALLTWQERPESMRLTRCRVRPAVNSIIPNDLDRFPECPAAERAHLRALEAEALEVSTGDMLTAAWGSRR